MPVRRLYLVMRNFVMTTPKIAPMGSTPIKTDCAADFEIVMPYSSTKFAMGTEVIYLRL